MNIKNRLLFMSLVTVLTLLANLVFPIAVFADDATPPPIPTEEPVQPSTDPIATEEPTLPQATDEATAEPTSPPTDEATVEPTLPPTEQATQESTPAQDDATVAQVLDQLPDNTQVVVVNDQGETVPLASQEAAQIIETGDPMWCPVISGVPTLPGGTGCTGSFNRFTTNSGLINALQVDAGSLYSGPGIIYVAQGNIVVNDQNKNIIMDGSLLSALSTGTLTIQGGWDFVSNTFSGNQSVFKNSTFQVVNWGNDVTINDIKLALTGISGDGLSIDTVNGDATISNVTVTGATQDGLFINGVDNASVSNSTFNDNTGDGLNVNAGGEIDVNNTTANRNEDNGAYLDNSTGSGDVNLTGTNTFDNNNDGLYVGSGGDINLNNVEANRNGEDGSYLDNCAWDGSTCVGLGDVTLTGMSAFDANGSSGLEIYSTGDINLDNIDASRNTAGDGAYLDNTYGSGSTYFTGSNNFNNNEDNGLEVYSYGDITFDGVSDTNANRNGESGLYLYNAYGGVANITLNDITANFNQDGQGVYAYASDDLTLTNGHFKGNDRRGLYAQSDYGNIDISLSDFINNGMSGLRAEAYNWSSTFDKGNITLDDIYSEKNGIHGANLGAAGDITITNDSEFVNNADSGVHIMGLLSDLSVSDSLFSENDKHGLYAEYVDGNVNVDGSVFTYNKKNGLNLPDVSGFIDITASDFLNNKHDGAYLYNCGCTISDITIDLSNFNDNHWNGLEAYSYGLISLDGVTADRNFDSGAYLDNTNGSANVDVQNSEFNNNGDATDEHGLWVETNGDVTLDNIIASNNYYAGASLGNYNTDSLIGGNASISNSTFNQNGLISDWDGLDVFAGGNINLTNVTADENGYAGVWLGGTYNDIPTSGNVKIVGSYFDDNDHQGVYISNLGSIFIDPSTFNNNGTYGIEAYSSGNIDISQVTATDNINGGAYLSTSGNAKVCDSTFISNGGYGIDASNVTGSFTQGNNIFSGNGSGDYTYSGSVTDCYPTSSGGGGTSKPSVIIPITGGEKVTCDAGQTSTTVQLSNGDSVTLPCPINEYAVVNSNEQNALPGSLGDGLTFMSSLTALVNHDNQSITSLDNSMVVSFAIPAGVDAKNLTILFWDGTQWQDLGGAVSADGLHFEVSTTQLGTFVLVKK